MNKKQKKFDDDDGRTIADMSYVSRQPIIIPKFNQFKDNKNTNKEEKEKNPWEDDSLSKQERRPFILGVLGATLLISSIFAIAFALAILFFMFLGK